MNATEHKKLRLVVRNQIIGMSQVNPLFEQAHRALSYAEKLHNGVRKDNITPEVNHQFNIASFFLGLIPMIRYCIRDVEHANLVINDCLVCIFLHDAIEDYPEESEAINALLTDKQKRLVNVLSKWQDGCKIDDKEYYNRLGNDIVTVIVKAIDRIHNLSTVKVLGESKTISYCEHTKYNLLPLLKRARNEYVEYTPILEHLKSVVNITIQCL
jgi:(p)ppGpp synthase/HD superfamily hydrolase